MVVGPYDLCEAPIAGAHPPRLLLPQVPERRPATGSRSSALPVAAAVHDLAIPLHIFCRIVSTVLLILARVRRRTYAGGSGSGSGSGGVLSWYVSKGS